MKNRSLGLIAPAVLLVCAACGTAATTTELVTARNAYAQARNSEAATLNPTGVHEAYKALEVAEAAHRDDAGSLKEKHYSYIATRKAETAIAEASGALAVTEQQRAKQGYQQALERRASEVAAQSSQYAQQLNQTQQALQQNQQALQQNSQQLQQREQELAATQLAANAAQDQLRKSESLREEAGRMIISLSGGVMFQTGGSELSAQARQRLDTVANALAAYADRDIMVEGHTDSQGNDEANRALSERRAEAVRSYLVSRGVPEARIRSVGRGEAEPVATNDTAEGRASNRRVEIVVEPQRPGTAGHDARSPDGPASTDAPTGANEARQPIPSSDTPAQRPPGATR
jgi:outer membrane protein OmpA-like peptidoglycan-associated protein